MLYLWRPGYRGGAGTEQRLRWIKSVTTVLAWPCGTELDTTW